MSNNISGREKHAMNETDVAVVENGDTFTPVEIETSAADHADMPQQPASETSDTPIAASEAPAKKRKKKSKKAKKPAKTTADETAKTSKPKHTGKPSPLGARYHAPQTRGNGCYILEGVLIRAHKQGKALTTKELAEKAVAAGSTRAGSATYMHLNTLREKGLIDNEKGPWALTKKGRKLVEGETADSSQQPASETSEESAAE